MNFIDLHCHTIATKKDEPETRNVKSKTYFLSKLRDAHVSICAITNHNFFGREQYDDFAGNDQGILVLPGIELDVNQDDGVRGHIILIGNNAGQGYKDFLSFVEKTKTNKKEDANSYSIGLEPLIPEIKKLDCFVIAHYGGKSPAINDETLKN
jgi:hypothetical protein